MVKNGKWNEFPSKYREKIFFYNYVLERISFSNERFFEFHLNNVDSNIKKTFKKIKTSLNNPQLNFQKYYIALNNGKNYAYFKFRKKKIVIVATMPYENVKRIIKKHNVVKLSDGVQRFYNAKSCSVFV